MRTKTSWYLRHAGLLAGVLALLATTCLVVFGALGHPIEGGGSENDGFVAGAETLLRGEWPKDRFRPMLYVLLTAALGLVTGDCFLAGKLVSTCAGGALVFLIYQLGRRVFDRPTGLLAALLLALHGTWSVHAVQASTDMLFAFTFTACLLAAVRAAQRPGLWPAARVGLCFALSWFARYTALALLPTVLLAVWVGAQKGTRMRRMAMLVGAIALGLAPHVTVSCLQFGEPFHDENWRSMAFRHFGSNDWGYLFNNPFTGTWSVLSHAPGVIWNNAIDELRSFTLGDGLPRLLATWAVDSWIGSVFRVLIGLAVVFGWQRRPRAAGHLLLALASYLVLVGTTFHLLWDRLTLPVLPGLLLLLAWCVLHLPPVRAGHPRWAPLRRWASGVAALLVAVPIGIAMPPVLKSFVDSQPIREVEVARALVRTHGDSVGLLTCYSSLARYVRNPVRWVSFGPRPEQTYAGVLNAVSTGSFEFLLISRQSVQDQPFALIQQAPVPKYLELLLDEPDLRLYRVVCRDLDPLLTGPIQWLPTGSGTFVLRCELRDDLPPGMTLFVSLLAPSTKVIPMVFTTEIGRVRSMTFDPGADRGWWCAYPGAATAEGTFYFGKGVSCEVLAPNAPAPEKR